MAVRGYPYNMPVAHFGSATDAATTMTPRGSFGQVGTFEYLRCGSIPFDDMSTTGGVVSHEFGCFLTLPGLHRADVELYDVENSLQISTNFVESSNTASAVVYLRIGWAQLWGNFPAGDAKIQPRYKLALTAGGAGTTNAKWHVGMWRIRRTV